MAKKKAKKRAAKASSNGSAKYQNLGRPTGAKSHVPRGLEVRQRTPLARANGIEKPKGLRRVILETVNENDAIRLQTLATLVTKKDPVLFRILDNRIA